MDRWNVLPSGVEELDEALVGQPYEWLSNFPNEKKDMSNALSAYKKKNYGEVIGNCYNAVEGISRIALNNKSTLDKNIKPFREKLSLSEQWTSFLNNFYHYANTAKRHADEGRHELDPAEIEAYLYLTGIFLRLASQKLDPETS